MPKRAEHEAGNEGTEAQENCDVKCLWYLSSLRMFSGAKRTASTRTRKPEQARKKMAKTTTKATDKPFKAIKAEKAKEAVQKPVPKVEAQQVRRRPRAESKHCQATM